MALGVAISAQKSMRRRDWAAWKVELDSESPSTAANFKMGPVRRISPLPQSSVLVGAFVVKSGGDQNGAAEADFWENTTPRGGEKIEKAQ